MEHDRHVEPVKLFTPALVVFLSGMRVLFGQVLGESVMLLIPSVLKFIVHTLFIALIPWYYSWC